MPSPPVCTQPTSATKTCAPGKNWMFGYEADGRLTMGSKTQQSSGNWPAKQKSDSAFGDMPAFLAAATAAASPAVAPVAVASAVAVLLSDRVDELCAAAGAATARVASSPTRTVVAALPHN